MKNSFKLYFGVAIAVSLLFNSCKKEEIITPNPIDNQETVYSKTQTKDNSNIESSVDDILNDVDSQLASSGARMEACDVSSTTITGTNKAITFSFNWSSCNGTTRTGEVVLTLESGTRYSSVGSIWKKQYKNVVIVSTLLGKNITLNGDVFLTNVSGGFPYRTLFSGSSPVVYKVRSSNMNVKLDTTTATRQWNMARKYTWSNVSNITTLSIEGDTTIGGYSKLIQWGKNRNGQDFYTQLPTSATVGLTCGSRPISATRTHTLERTSGNIVSEEKVTTNSACASTYAVSVKVNGNIYNYAINY